MNFRQDIVYRVKTTASADLPRLFKEIVREYPKLYPNHRTLDNYYSVDVRVPISERFGINSPEHKLSKVMVALSYTDKGNLIKENKKKVFDKNNNRTVYSMKDGQDIIDAFIDSDDPVKIGLLLLLASGSRPIEIFMLSEFEIYEDWILQSTLAKKKEDTNVIKPVIFISNTKFIELFEKMKRLLENRGVEKESGQLHSTISDQANRFIKKINAHMTSYSLRKMYGLLSYELVGKYPNRYGKNMSNSNWLSYVLGHAEGSVASVHNYSNVSMKEKDQEVQKDHDIFKKEKSVRNHFIKM